MKRATIDDRENMAYATTMPDLQEMGVIVPDALKKNLDWYIEHQKDLATKYNGKILLIVDQRLVDTFDSMQHAYSAAAERYTPGTFTLQPCSPDAESFTVMLYSPAYSAMA